jgi:cell division control protein 6
MRGSREISKADVDDAYDAAQYVHLSHSLDALSDNEATLIEVIANNDGDRAGEIYEAFREATDLGYTRYSEVLNKLDELGLVETAYADIEGRGRTRSISLSYESEAVLERL